jgi:hypothetical protein
MTPFWLIGNEQGGEGETVPARSTVSAVKRRRPAGGNGPSLVKDCPMVISHEQELYQKPVGKISSPFRKISSRSNSPLGGRVLIFMHVLP